MINVYKDWASCCGYMPLGVSIKIQAPRKQGIEDLDTRVCAKIMEICEREGIKYYKCELMEIT